MHYCAGGVGVRVSDRTRLSSGGASPLVARFSQTTNIRDSWTLLTIKTEFLTFHWCSEWQYVQYGRARKRMTKDGINCQSNIRRKQKVRGDTSNFSNFRKFVALYLKLYHSGIMTAQTKRRVRSCKRCRVHQQLHGGKAALGGRLHEVKEFSHQFRVSSSRSSILSL